MRISSASNYSSVDWSADLRKTRFADKFWQHFFLFFKKNYNSIFSYISKIVKNSMSFNEHVMIIIIKSRIINLTIRSLKNILFSTTVK